MIESGELKKLIDGDGLKGVTSNPAIFQKAIAGSPDYDEAIRGLVQAGESVQPIYETLAVEDVGRAADVFRPGYDRVEGRTASSVLRSTLTWPGTPTPPSPRPGVCGRP